MQTSTSFGSFLVAVLSASMAAGSVIPATNANAGFFEVKRTANAGFKGRNGPLALARAYEKYGIPVSADLKQAVANRKAAQNAKRASGTAVATPDNEDLEYLVPVKIGTPAQTLNLDFDTGSSDLWVFSSETPSSSRSGHDIYTPTKSSTSSKLSGATWDISYGDGSSSSGDVYLDAVTVGGLTVQKQAVESAKKVSSQFASGNNDGLLGLGFSSINTVSPTQQKTWFDNIKPTLDQPIFVADLRHDTAGSYTFGALPSGASNVQYTSVDNSQGFWEFSTSSSFSSSGFDAIADTGTTLLLTDDAQVDAYYAKVSGATFDNNQGGYVYACGTTLPSYTFTVGSGQITIPGSLMNYAAADGSNCFGGLQSSGGLPFAIFGDIALKAAYVVFDGGNTRLGWAQKA